MEVSEFNDDLCIELDSASMFSDYLEYIGEFSDEKAVVEQDMQTVLHRPATTVSRWVNGYANGDDIIGYRDQTYLRFPLP